MGEKYTNGLKVENYGRGEGLMRYKTHLHRNGQRERIKTQINAISSWIHSPKDSSPSHTNPRQSEKFPAAKARKKRIEVRVQEHA